MAHSRLPRQVERLDDNAVIAGWVLEPLLHCAGYIEQHPIVAVIHCLAGYNLRETVTNAHGARRFPFILDVSALESHFVSVPGTFQPENVETGREIPVPITGIDFEESSLHLCTAW